MHTLCRMPLIIAVPLVVSMILGSLAAHASAGQPSSGPAGRGHDPATYSSEEGQPGPLVSLRLHALALEKVQLSDPTQGVVRATVLAIDAEINQIKVQTDKGQRLMLYLTPASIARLHVGAPCLLHVAQQSARESTYPPEHEEAFWEGI